MILLAGIPSEPPLAEVLDVLRDERADVVVLNQRRFAELEIAYAVDPDGGVDGLLQIGRRRLPLRGITAVYARLMDHRSLPEHDRLAPHDPERARCARLTEDLTAWIDVCPGRVVNRTGAMASNGSKPFQAQLIARHGFRTPETVITNDPEVARAFYASRQRVVYKSVSGVRSIVQTMGQGDLDRLEQVRACPVQFQEYVPGLDVRVHVVGPEVFATSVTTTATDYRYAVRQVDEPARLAPVELDPQVAERCVALAADLGLEFAGIDLKLHPDGETYCFEVNPSPAYTYFEGQTGQPIAATVAHHLMQA
jgi:predicted ATP-grasp superfamily ATP-dependent carboligase